MARSMTGFGRSQVDLDNRRCVVEIRTVNSKYCDLQIKIPRVLYGIEYKIRKYITADIFRGKVEVYIVYEDFREESKRVNCDMALVNEYNKVLQKISSVIGSDERIFASTIARFSDVLIVSSDAPDDDESWNFIYPAISEALHSLSEMRDREGSALVSSISEHVEALRDMYCKVMERSPRVAVEFAVKLRTRITELTGDLAEQIIDEQRLATEIAIFADKCSVDEELTRLDSHIIQFGSTLIEKGSIGKKLDFIVQEMNREINTIGSKANDVIITGYVVQMKNIVEKIREQIQNLE